jgi:hypothetical protein
MQKSGRHFSEVRSAEIGAFPKEEKQFSVPARPWKLLDQVRDVIRRKHFSPQ